MYPDATYSQAPRSSRKKFLIIFGALCGLALLFVIVLGATHKVQQNKISDNLQQYDGALFSVKYPKDFGFSLTSATGTKFLNKNDDTEYFTIDFNPVASAPVNPQTILFYKNRAQEKDKAKVADLKINNIDASSVTTTDSSKGLTTETVYLFAPDYVWTFNFVSKSSSTLTKSKNTILGSFKATLSANPTSTNAGETDSNQPNSTSLQTANTEGQ